jgi:hypothetical protein
MTTLNVEADEILYRSAFAVERKGWILTSKSGKSKDFGNEYTKTKIKKMLKDRDKEIDVDYTLESYPIVEDVSHCLVIIKNTLRRLSKHGDLKLWLTASDHSNFRYGIIETEGPRGLGYKAGRPPRPVHYQAARDYLIDKCGAEEIHGYEADDALCMYQNSDTIATHIDKDINMVVGRHLNWVTMEFYESPEGLGTLEINEKRKVIGRGLKFFYHQLLTGDATDNIPGVKGMGPITAFKVLDECLTEEECRTIVNSIYLAKFGEGYESRLAEVADLLWMVRDDLLTGRQYLELP